MLLTDSKFIENLECKNKAAWQVIKNKSGLGKK